MLTGSDCTSTILVAVVQCCCSHMDALGSRHHIRDFLFSFLLYTSTLLHFYFYLPSNI